MALRRRFYSRRLRRFLPGCRLVALKQTRKQTFSAAGASPAQARPFSPGDTPEAKKADGGNGGRLAHVEAREAEGDGNFVLTDFCLALQRAPLGRLEG